jgi:hypothetical protein
VKVFDLARKRLHRYSGLISFLGVVVILATFIVKDVLRDDAKDELAAMERAGRAYDSRVATDEIRALQFATIDRLDSQTETKRNPVPHLRNSYYPLGSRVLRLKGLCELLPKNEAEIARKGTGF